MSMVDALLPEFDHEMTTTRKLLERVPDDRLAWKPHEKSMSIGGLATHLSMLPWWGLVTLNDPEFDLAAFPNQNIERARGRGVVHGLLSSIFEHLEFS